MSANQVRTSLREGAQGYILLFSMEGKKEIDLTNLPVVSEFPEVFPDDVPGLPPEREIEFSVDLLLGTSPISMAPYQMSLAELIELKKQLEELLSK